MILLSFAAQNHKSLRDEAVVEFIKPTLKTLRPSAGTWSQHVHRVAGIFGPNASGKSAVLDALRYMIAAIRESGSAWLDDRTMRWAPFRLDAEHPNLPSRYVLDFVHAERRYEYGFEVTKDGIVQEWLYDLPGVRRRLLFNRSGREVKLSRTIPPVGPLASRELLLSRAIRLDHEPLAMIAHALIDGIDIVPLGEVFRQHRISAIVDDLFSGTSTPESIQAILQMADLGITQVRLREDRIPAEYVRILRRLRQVLSAEESEDRPEPADLSIEETEAVIRGLEFHHQGTGETPFSMFDESDGTLAWLALAAPAIERIRQGGVFVVDEIDASLHSQLVETLVGFFTDPEVNTKAAQILFTSHDSYLLSPLAGVRLEPGQVWFTDKGLDGATELFSLAEFPRHPDANIAKRYLSGRYGAIPSPAPSLVHRLLEPEVGAR